MGDYIDVGGVNTWYDGGGTGEPLALLHGGLCTNETWGAPLPGFADRVRVVAPERRRHGHARAHRRALPGHPELGAGRDPRHLPRGRDGEARDLEPRRAHLPRERAFADNVAHPARRDA